MTVNDVKSDLAGAGVRFNTSVNERWDLLFLKGLLFFTA
jgi:hypothetical protein